MISVLVATFLPGVFIALLIRVDAKLIGPYFALSELVPGLPGYDAPFWYRRSSIRWALTRRVLYPAICGVLLALLGHDFWTSVVAGALGGFLLVWPGLFMPPVRGVSRRDWRFPALNCSMVVAAAGLAGLGFIVIEIMTALGEGDILAFVLENLFIWAVTIMITAMVLAFTKGTYTSLREKAERDLQLDSEDRSGPKG